jgi:hypothetical protein
VADDIARFKEVLVDYKGDAHEPRHFKLVWGENSIFKGRVTAVGITHKLFNSDGTPIRAIAKVTFKSSIEEEKRAAKEDKKSPDLTRVRKVKRGDTLPQLCFDVYGDPKYYIQVARVNALTNFRELKPGVDLLFPPIEKSRPVS